MSTKTIEVNETQGQLTELISLALEGNEIILVKGGKPLVKLIPVNESNQRVEGLNQGTIWVSEDFDEPLSDEFWTGNA